MMWCGCAIGDSAIPHARSMHHMSLYIMHPSTPQKVIAYGISRGREGLDTSSKERPARPRDIPYECDSIGVSVIV